MPWHPISWACYVHFNIFLLKPCIQYSKLILMKGEDNNSWLIEKNLNEENSV